MERKRMGAEPVLYLVIPCYNEEEVLPKTAPMFLEKLEALTAAGALLAALPPRYWEESHSATEEAAR